MRGAGVRVGMRVVGGAQAVEFADQREARAGAGALDAALDAGEGEPGLRFEAKPAHRLGDEGGGLLLVEPGLGVVQDRLAELDDLVAAAIDRLAHRLLQFVLAGHSPSPQPVAQMIQAA